MIWLILANQYTVPLWLLKIVWYNLWIGVVIAFVIVLIIVIGDRSDEIDPDRVTIADDKQLAMYSYLTSVWAVRALCFLLIGVPSFIVMPVIEYLAAL